MIRRELNDKHTLMKRLHYPAVFRRKGGYQVLLGIGGNIGDVVRRFEHLLYYLRRNSRLRVIETAPILKNPPFGYKNQADFYNSLMRIETFLKPKALLRYLLHVEKVFGRKRLFKDAPRTLDIDIVFYENVKMDTKELTLPHPEWMNRDSVLIPLLHMKGRVK
ncbi:MAG: 2-amino-4-hydroxy-6-hydroxymethyldihydropteridine diphosphokinase [Campylobacterota bacterium]|nr:2-amino-4-hydroxy-6-hydroxymethyldihydropteridine diphosphokinase [Campylobacterota bacterium]